MQIFLIKIIYLFFLMRYITQNVPIFTIINRQKVHAFDFFGMNFFSIIIITTALVIVH